MSKPRARVVVVDGRARPLRGALEVLRGRDLVGVVGAHRPRVVDSERFEWLVEDAPFSGSAPMRTRGVDALVVIAGRDLTRHADALASARANGAPLVVTVSQPHVEADVRATLADAGFDADDAIAVALGARDAGVLAAIDRVTTRAGHVHVADVLPGGKRVVVRGDGPVEIGSDVGRVLTSYGFVRARFTIVDAVRAGELAVMTGFPDDAPCATTEPSPCAFGVLPLVGPYVPPPTPLAIALTAACEVPALVDGRGRIVLKAPLPVGRDGRVGIYVASAPMRPTTHGELGAHVLVSTIARGATLFDSADATGACDVVVDNERVGRVHIERTQAAVIVRSLHVDPDRRCAGLGGRIFDTLYDEARVRDVALTIDVASNEVIEPDKARAFLVRHGLRAITGAAAGRIAFSSQ